MTRRYILVTNPHADADAWLDVMCMDAARIFQALRAGGIDVADEAAARRFLAERRGQRVPLYGCASPCSRNGCMGFGATGRGCPGYVGGRLAN